MLNPRRFSCAMGVVGLLMSLASVPAAAQDHPTAMVAAGYSALTDSRADVTAGKGWLASAALRVQPFYLVVEGSGHYATADDGAEVRMHSALIGARYATAPRAVTPFIQVLVGLGCYCGTTATLGEVSRAVALQPGAGFDVGAARAWAIRLQADYRWFGGKESSHQVRFAGSFVLRFHR